MKKIFIALFVVLAALDAGCSRRAEPSPWLGQALASHRQADDHLRRGDLDGARASLVELVESDAHGGLAASDARAVLQDALFRLSEVEMADGRPGAALAWIERGLGLGDEGDLFAANLYVNQGRALQRLGRDAEAARAYHRALVINDGLLAAALGEQAGKTERNDGSKP